MTKTVFPMTRLLLSCLIGGILKGSPVGVIASIIWRRRLRSCLSKMIFLIALCITQTLAGAPGTATMAAFVSSPSRAYWDSTLGQRLSAGYCRLECTTGRKIQIGMQSVKTKKGSKTLSKTPRAISDSCMSHVQEPEILHVILPESGRNLGFISTCLKPQSKL